jgi:putative transposase
VRLDHLHLLAEASERRALSRGLQGLSIRLAKAVNRHLRRSGRVFAERYHARTRASTAAIFLPVLVDGCSSVPWFGGWAPPTALAFVARKDLSEGDAPVVAPTTWSLRAGYQRAGPIDTDDAPVRAGPH